MALTAREQYLLELINRARLDPGAEAARLGIGLNDGLAAGMIDGTAKQVLAPNALLEQAATAHSIWMLDHDSFSHTGAGGSSPGGRATAAGYAWTAVGENIATRYGSTLENAVSAIRNMHDSLLQSAGHRQNMLNPIYQEVGLGHESGLYTPPSGSTEYQAWMLTELFGRRTGDVFLTGVAYDDTNGDAFYTPGEGTWGVGFTIGGATATTAGAGGYALQVTPGTDVTVTGSHTGGSFEVLLDLSAGNVKLDLVGGTRLLSSGNLRLVSGITEAALLGRADLTLTGSNDNDILDGNAGANLLSGQSGDDLIHGNDGNDTLYDGSGNDTLYGDAGDDLLSNSGFGDDLYYAGEGNDTLHDGFGEDTLHGGTGDDSISASFGNDVLYGEAGNDTLSASFENDLLYGGSGDDQLSGSFDNDTLHGETGNDSLYGSSGHDVLYGGEGDDTLRGSSDSDLLYGDDGNDTLTGGDGDGCLYGGAGDDTLDGRRGNHLLHGGSGNDLIYSSYGRNEVIGGAGTDTLTYQGRDTGILFDYATGLVVTAEGADTVSGIEHVIGTSYDDRLTGGSWMTVEGGGGNDTLAGSVMEGGYGNDSYLVDSYADTVTDTAGSDTIITALVSYSIFSKTEIEHLTGTAAGAQSLTGNGSGNRISAGAGDDTLIGGAGHDTLDGGAGTDRMEGGTGSDSYYVDSYGDQVIEYAGGGTDTIITALAAWSIFGQADVEDLTGTASTGQSLTGNTGNNRISAGAGADTLIGGVGHDRLDGGAGADRMDGGTGSDTYYVDDYGDQVIEYANGGTDTIITTLSGYSIFSKTDIEHLTGTAAGAQTLTGNAGNNRISAGAGDDTLIGGAGHDTLNGGTGADRMEGGSGDDLYTVDSYGDQVIEYAGGGTDTVQTALAAWSIFSRPEVENLTGTAYYDGPGVGQALTGNNGNNVILGSSGYDTLNGGAGNDTLSGGGAGDRLTGGSGADVFLFSTAIGGNNVETLTDFAPGQDMIHLQRWIFAAAGPAGALDPARFVIGQTATTAAQRIIYDEAHGSLYYDSDGTGGQGQIWIAKLGAGLALSASDFLLV